MFLMEGKQIWFDVGNSKFNLHIYEDPCRYEYINAELPYMSLLEIAILLGNINPKRITSN